MAKVIRSFSTPAGASQGMGFDSKYLWVVDLDGKAYCIDKNGVIIKSITLPALGQAPVYPRGICCYTKDYFLCTSSDDPDGWWYKIRRDGTVIRTHVSPNSGVGDHHTRGLTFDSKYIWLCDSGDDILYKIDLEGNLISYKDFSGTIDSMSDITTDGKNLWIVDYDDDKIWKLDKKFNIITNFNAPSNNCKGITFDGKYLYINDSTADLIYQVAI